MSFCHRLVATWLTCRGGYGNGSPEARSFKAAVNLMEQDKLPQTTQPEAEDNQPGQAKPQTRQPHNKVEDTPHGNRKVFQTAQDDRSWGLCFLQDQANSSSSSGGKKRWRHHLSSYRNWSFIHGPYVQNHNGMRRN